MKKILITAAFIAAATPFTANAWMYNTSCGRAVQTVPPEYFEDKDEREEFYKELDDIYCKNENDKEEADGPVTSKP